MTKVLNERPLEHRCRNGTTFMAARCDFVGGVTAYVPLHLTLEEIIADAVELGAWHALNILPQLNGFTGPGTFTVHRERRSGATVLDTPLLKFFSLERLREENELLGRRPYNALSEERALRQSGSMLPPIETVGEFIQHMTRKELRKVPNLGNKSIDLIERVLHSAGLELST